MNLSLAIKILNLCVITGSLVAMYRLRIASKFRMGLLEKVFQFIDWEWRFKELEKVTLNQLVFSFGNVSNQRITGKICHSLKHTDQPIKSFTTTTKMVKKGQLQWVLFLACCYRVVQFRCPLVSVE